MRPETPINAGGAHVLIVDCDAEVATSLGSFLQSRGNIVDYSLDGMSALQLIEQHGYDAVVLEVALPGLDGLTLCRRVRSGSHGDIPLLIHSLKAEPHDRLAGFEAGADDYVVKPAFLLEVQARLRALLRRASHPGSMLRVGDLNFDTRTLVVRRNGRRVDLGPSALRLLEKLMRVSPAVVPQAEATRLLWGDDPPSSNGCLRGHVHALRMAIDGPGSEKLVHTIRGLGYRLAPALDD